MSLKGLGFRVGFRILPPEFLCLMAYINMQKTDLTTKIRPPKPYTPKPGKEDETLELGAKMDFRLPRLRALLGILL